MGVPNVFANATTSIPLVQLDQNFNTGLTIGNTTVGLGNTSTTFTPNSTAGIVGTTTNDSANAGSIGEFIETTVVSGSAVSYSGSAGSGQNVMSISLTAGDWDVQGLLATSGGPPSNGEGGFNTVTGTLPAGHYITINSSVSSNGSYPLPRRRFSVSGNTTVYMVMGFFNPNGVAGYGYMNARRVR